MCTLAAWGISSPGKCSPLPEQWTPGHSYSPAPLGAGVSHLCLEKLCLCHHSLHLRGQPHRGSSTCLSDHPDIWINRGNEWHSPVLLLLYLPNISMNPRTCSGVTFATRNLFSSQLVPWQSGQGCSSSCKGAFPPEIAPFLSPLPSADSSARREVCRETRSSKA